MAETPILEFENVDTYYGNIQVLYDITLKVYTGELVCLLGGNASGKSTTLKTILGACKIKKGVVKLERSRHRPRKPQNFSADDGSRESGDGCLSQEKQK
jgi:branched-chain amino acid transport system ATP-binding protein